jgi:hypothetical protein
MLFARSIFSFLAQALVRIMRCSHHRAVAELGALVSRLRNID